ncbi:hypothetical protein [Plebeiibacterium sediminum]|uniref:Acetylxylan esterase n=1 Tax=Plebeiibacterium sediminum TaxID=2992112 RepID=A0AAE3M363_9BACT|nr:hypothetical protein [Plebeiobacterium sediminum]MCW3785967.1 hypothetical protein [Plebeiobacterium sediminum]
MKKITIFFCLIMITFTCAIAQNSDNKFARPLKDVLKDIEQEYNVKLRISDKDVEGKILNYANWRFRADVEETLKNVLAPFDLMALPDNGENKYKIEEFRYHRRTVEEGKETLDYLASKYSTKDEWQQRQAKLKQCVKEAVRLNHMPTSPDSKPILTKIRKMNGYTVQNIALEVLPGFYVCGSIYRPAKIKGKIPVVLCPNGHFGNGRYNKDIQTRCAGLARMGAMAINYDLFAWGESVLQVDPKTHRKSLANTIQALNSIRLLDYLTSFKYADTTRIGITGGSGGGSHSILMSVLDDRIDVSVPTVMMSSIHYGGCPCESGNPIHLCCGGTNNVELAGVFAPKPQLIISDGGDWTSNVPELEFPYLKRIYNFYDNAVVENVHLPKEHHDYGPLKRTAMYHFMAKHLKLDESKVFNKEGELDESAITVEDENAMKVFGDNGEKLPKTAIRSFDVLAKEFESAIAQ